MENMEWKRKINQEPFHAMPFSISISFCGTKQQTFRFIFFWLPFFILRVCCFLRSLWHHKFIGLSHLYVFCSLYFPSSHTPGPTVLHRRRRSSYRSPFRFNQPTKQPTLFVVIYFFPSEVFAILWFDFATLLAMLTAP